MNVRREGLASQDQPDRAGHGKWVSRQSPEITSSIVQHVLIRCTIIRCHHGTSKPLNIG